MREKQCKKCGKYFRPKKSMKQIYCKTCTNKKEILKICPVCKKNFPIKHGNQIYCCTECAVIGKKMHKIKKEMHQNEKI